MSFGVDGEEEKRSTSDLLWFDQYCLHPPSLLFILLVIHYNRVWMPLYKLYGKEREWVQK